MTPEPGDIYATCDGGIERLVLCILWAKAETTQAVLPRVVYAESNNGFLSIGEERHDVFQMMVAASTLIRPANLEPKK